MSLFPCIPFHWLLQLDFKICRYLKKFSSNKLAKKLEQQTNWIKNQMKIFRTIHHCMTLPNLQLTSSKILILLSFSFKITKTFLSLISAFSCSLEFEMKFLNSNSIWTDNMEKINYIYEWALTLWFCSDKVKHEES